MVVRGTDLAVEYVIKDPLRTMSVRGRAPARLLDSPTDVYASRTGVPTTLEVDLTWRTEGVPYHYDVTSRYEIPCLVTGEVRVGSEVIPIDGQGQRDHSWGVRDWWDFGWCWAAARLNDGARVHWAHIRLPDGAVALGYVQRDGAVEPVEGVAVQESLGPEGVPSRAAARVEPGNVRLDIEPRWFAPALLVAPDGRISRFPRAWCPVLVRGRPVGERLDRVEPARARAGVTVGPCACHSDRRPRSRTTPSSIGCGPGSPRRTPWA